MRKITAPEVLFWRHVEKTETCWIWAAGKSVDGYGRFRMRDPRRNVQAHRFAYELAYGEIPAGLTIVWHAF